MANIAIAKLGKSIVFDRKKWSHIGGTYEPADYSYMMAKTYPQHTFYIISPTDYHKLFPKKLLPNLISVWAPEYWENNINPKRYLDIPWETDSKTHEKYYQYPVDVLKKLNVNIDFAFIHLGLMQAVSMHGIIPSKDGTRSLRPRQSSEIYAAPVINWINHYSGEYVWIISDARMFNTFCPDYTNVPPAVSLSQWNCTRAFKSGKNAKDTVTAYNSEGKPVHIENKFPQVYSGFETTSALDKIPIPIEEDFSIREGFSVLCNCDGNNSPLGEGMINKNSATTPRYEVLKRYILNDTSFNCAIYGEWPEHLVNGDTRFKGILPATEIGKAYQHSKYTLIFAVPGFSTTKFVEACHFGIIPFCVDTYATLADCTYIPKFLVVHDAKEMHAKAEFLDKNPEAYIKLRKYFKKFLDEECYTGKYYLDLQAKYLKQYTSFDLGPMQLSDIPMEVRFRNDIESLNTNVDIDDLF